MTNPTSTCGATTPQKAFLSRLIQPGQNFAIGIGATGSRDPNADQGERTSEPESMRDAMRSDIHCPGTLPTAVEKIELDLLLGALAIGPGDSCLAMAAVTMRNDFDGTGRTDGFARESTPAAVPVRANDELEEASMANSTANRLHGF
jgi:hypothetical protein